MSGPVSIRDCFESCGPTKECSDPENCTEMHNENEDHHYGCECGGCIYEYWLLKH